jgi:hypothetical protein
LPGFVPERDFAARAHTEHERLFGSGMGVAQVSPNVPKFVTVAMEPPVASAGKRRARASSTNSL